MIYIYIFIFIDTCAEFLTEIRKIIKNIAEFITGVRVKPSHDLFLATQESQADAFSFLEFISMLLDALNIIKNSLALMPNICSVGKGQHNRT